MSRCLAFVPVLVAACAFGAAGDVVPAHAGAVAGTATAAPSLRVSPSGNDASCARGGAAPPCASLNRAYALAQPGDVVEIEGGAYPAQTVLQSSANGKPGSAPVVFRAAPRQRVTFHGTVQLGIDGASTAPSFVTFDGGRTTTIVGHFAVNWGGGAKPSHDTLADTHLLDPSDSQGALVFTRDVSYFTARGNDVGPACCSSDGIGIEIRDQGDPVPDHITLVDNTIHDLYDSCTEWPSRLGPCSGPGYGDPGGCSAGNCDHVDGIQAFGGLTMDIERNAVYLQGDHKQAIFLGSGNSTGVPYANLTIQNNAVSATSDQALSFYATSGYVNILYNTILGKVSVPDSSLPSWIQFVPGTAVKIIGNIFGGQAGGTQGGGCTATYSDGTTLVPTWSHNLMAQMTCGPGDTRGQATFVRADFSASAAPDLRLVRGSKGLGAGDPTLHPRDDIDGQLRPSQLPPDSGASQRETALVVPASSLGAVRLGERRADVLAFYGPPGSRRRGATAGSSIEVYRVHGGRLAVGYGADGTVVSVATTSRYYTTASGLGVGAALPGDRLRPGRCAGIYALVGGPAGLRVQATAAGTVTGLTVARGAGRC